MTIYRMAVLSFYFLHLVFSKIIPYLLGMFWIRGDRYEVEIFAAWRNVSDRSGIDSKCSNFDNILKQLDAGKPLLIWTTVELKPTDAGITWKGPNGAAGRDV